MVTKIAASQYLLISHFSCPVISFTGLKNCPDRRQGLHPVVAMRRKRSDSWCRLCTGVKENNSEAELEVEILEFMNKSEKPDKFPTKKELLNGGRMDLVDAIIKNGGWLSLGWEVDESDEQEECTRPGYTEVESTSSSSQSALSSGRSLDMAAEDDKSGILGILNGLENQRNLSLGTNLGSNGYQTEDFSEYNGVETNFGYSRDMDKFDPGENIGGESGSSTKRMLSNSVGELSSNGFVSDIDDSRYSFNPDMWRIWCRERAAAEICFSEDQVEGKNDKSPDRIPSETEGAARALDGKNEFNHRQIQRRLQQMGHELATTLHLLKSKSKDLYGKDQESTSRDLQKLSDAWEFYENDIMNAQTKLRSIRANLAILEGKMALSIMESQKIVEEKQRRIDFAQSALQLLRTTSVIWPNSASEVLLAGSFDGWITQQRKMEKSRTGVFSLTLQLYPGRYEIKFIVDGVWRCDPLRPTVHNDGYENNIIIVT